MQIEVNGLQSQLDYMLDVVDKCRTNKLAGRLAATLSDTVSTTMERHGKLQTDIGDTLSQIELAQSNVEDFEVRTAEMDLGSFVMVLFILSLMLLILLSVCPFLSSDLL